MCEISMIFGMDAQLGKTGAEELARMMAAGAAFNSHGWGIFGDQSAVVKKPKRFSMVEERDAIMTSFGANRFLVGHVRFATHGKMVAENTHPLAYKRWILVHNGVISNEMKLRRKHKIPDAPEVDSHVIVWLVNKFYKSGKGGIEKAIKKATNELEGWYSCFLYDTERKRLFYFRHGADFHFKLVKSTEGDHYVVGNTKKANIGVAFSRSAWGFRINAAKTLGYIHPKQSILYEVSDKGLTVLCELPSPPEVQTKVTERRFVADMSIDQLAAYYDTVYDGKTGKSDAFGETPDDDMEVNAKWQTYH
jgi:predicted glutamine amidotransferase